MNSEKSSDNGPSGTVAKIITILNDDIDDDDDDVNKIFEITLENDLKFDNLFFRKNLRMKQLLKD